MTQMNNQQVRVIDPILTTHAQGYRHQTHVGIVLFPRAPVAVSGGQILEFGKEAFRLYNARRTPGSSTKRVQYGHAGKPFALVQDALEGMVPREHLRDASQVPGINLGQRAVNNTMGSLSLTLEVEQAELARNPDNYDNDHKVDLASSQWTDDNNNPCKDIRTGQEAVRESIGMDANTLLLSAKGFAAMRENPYVLERFKYTSKDSITAAMIAALLDIDKVEVGKAVSADANDKFSDVWGTDAILAYVAPPGGDNSADAAEPSYGYTYTMDGHPLVEEAYYDNNAKSWIYPVTYERRPVLSGITAGYLMRNVG
ncbi:hypothetical protein ACJJIQ_09065 [Microbulbifer sp. ANSA003]|uniref:hypothetical protein n=1 Tax=Microbulbifer sp. ANSA003 TaxID=3243360 RepID=UPI004042153A